MTDEVKEAGAQMICSPGQCIRANERRAALIAAVRLIERDYSLGIMEAHRDGHPISQDARPVWDAIWNALEGEDAYLAEVNRQESQ